MNDEHSRKEGDANHPYGVFRRMLVVGRPPEDWEEFLQQSTDMGPPSDQLLR